MSASSLRIGVLQMRQSNGQLESNVLHLRQLLSSLEVNRLDLLVLPEMWNSGFVVKELSCMDHAYDIGLAEMRSISQTFGCAVYGSLIKKIPNNGYVNSGVWISPDSSDPIEYYKAHLFAPGGEAQLFMSGNERVIVYYRDFRILLSICYDLRFPSFLRYSSDAPYDLLLSVANWPRPRQEVWRTLLTARAIENQCYVVGCNRVGVSSDGLSYPGYSMVLGPKGKLLAFEPDEVEALLYAEIDYSELVQFRQKFPVLDDADRLSLVDYKVRVYDDE